ncbi:hypothetical protein [Priestia megaterium]|uniref:hypothetical protein n=1 Tax=Priestia megaterium TaxID=1404 RepID=UPI002795D5EC|nr:hypothetical protein [Priestia megaterium]
MLSELFMGRVYKALNHKGYRSEDFSIIHYDASSKDVKQSVVLTIKYRYKEEFFISSRVLNSTFEYIKISPGRIMQFDVKSQVGAQEFLNTISDWIETLDNYFSNDPISRNLLKTQEKIDQLERRLNETLGDLEDEFRDDEIHLLKEQLNNIEKELTEKLNQQIQDQEVLQTKVEELHRDLQILRNQVGPLNKKNWLLSYYTKAYLWNQDNPSFLPKSLLHIGHKFLPENIQNTISTEFIDSAVDSLLPQPDEEKSKTKQK